MSAASLQPHPEAARFPDLAGDEFAALVADVAAQGLLESIVLHEGKILDGRHRYAACLAAGVEPQFVEWDGRGGTAREFVVSLNLHRRHLTPSQRAILALDDLDLLAQEAKARQGTRTDLANIPQRIAEGSDGESRSLAAETWGTNRQYVSDARRVRDQAPELLPAILGGELSIPEAIRKLGGPHVARATGENEWYTPAEIVAAARATMGGIDLDPASTPAANEVVGATSYWTSEDDGLSKPWAGRVFLNPPYAADLVGRFTSKLVEHLDAGDVSAACVLVNNATETAWFQALATRAPVACFPRGRVKFWQPDRESAAPLQGQAVIYLGAHAEQFAEAFSTLGWITYPSPASPRDRPSGAT